ncbi:MAG: Rne/Rng family ribonuclease [Clostridiales bacterium]|nr:Rne/Rng family ribonuclease [Clostridiales bacterium]
MKEIVVDAGFGQVRTALLEDGELVEIYIEGRENRSIVGDIYKGKVENVLPGMQAAFVEIGTEKNAFLFIKDILPDYYHGEEEEDIEDKIVYNICDLVKTGQDILVQVIKDPIDSKGARITTHITLPGRFVVLMPTVDYIGISRKIEDEKERERLKEIASTVKPENMGLIIRTAGEHCDAAELKSDIELLVKLWGNILKKNYKVSSPNLLHRDMDLFDRILRDIFTHKIDRLIINDRNLFNKAVEMTDEIAPNLKERIEYYSECFDIFNYFHIEEKIEGLLDKKVWLKSGGYIIIEQVEALTAIDVNTGKCIGGKDLYDIALKTNIEAAKEIARQLRLRDIGGIIIIDFIDMQNESQQNIVIEVIKNALKKDSSKSSVWGMTHLGLLELTRKKTVPPKEDMMLTGCPYCLGTGKILSPLIMIKMMEKDLKRLPLVKSNKDITIEIHPEMKGILSGYSKYFNTFELNNNVKINFEFNESLHRDKYNIKVY